MKKILYTTTLLIFLPVGFFSPFVSLSVPEWFMGQYEGEAGWCYGKGSAIVENNEWAQAEEKAKTEAIKDVASTLHSRVWVMKKNKIEEDRKNNRTVDTRDYFSDESQIVSDLEIANCRIIKCERDKKNMYILVGIPATDLRNIYKLRLERLINEIGADLKSADMLSSSKPHEAIALYQKCLAKYADLAENKKIYLLLNNWNDDTKPMTALIPAEEKIAEKLHELAGRTPQTISEIAEDLLEDVPQEKLSGGSLLICPFQFERSNLVPAFGYDLADAMNKCLVDKKVQIAQPSKGISFERIIKGNISESGGGLLITAALVDKGCRQIAAMEAFVASNSCKSVGWDRIRPERWGRELLDEMAFYNAVTNDPCLKVWVRTEKNEEHPVYFFGDKPVLMVKANRECYVTILDKFPDGRDTLLIANYHIGSANANEWVKMPGEIEVCEPAGTEQLLVMACTEQIPIPPTVRETAPDGEGYIDVIVKTRGIKKKKETLYTEKNWQWTVLKK